MNPNRIPPQALEMEQAVLGSMLIERAAIYRSVPIVKAADFYREAHRLIFEAIITLSDRDEPVDMLTVQDQLKLQGNLDVIGGTPYLFNLLDAVPTAANVEHYARVVRDKAYLRRVIFAGSQMVHLAHSEYETIDDVRSVIEALCHDAVKTENARYQSDIRSIISTVWDDLEQRYENPGKTMGISTGFPAMDYITGGITGGSLVVLGARPGLGKSALAMNIARNVSQNHGTTVFFSLEMSKEQLVRRALCADSKVNVRSIRTGNLLDHEWRQFGASVARMSEIELFIFDDSSPTVSQMKSICRDLSMDRNLALVVVDYLQLVTPQRRSDSRTQEVGQISRGLKAMARDLDCPVLALAQLNRSPEGRSNKRPTSADLRESGDIEADADLIWLLHSEDHYKRREQDVERPDGAVDLIIDKHRDGAVGMVPLWFNRQWARFDPRTEDEGHA